MATAFLLLRSRAASIGAPFRRFGPSLSAFGFSAVPSIESTPSPSITAGGAKPPLAPPAKPSTLAISWDEFPAHWRCNLEEKEEVLKNIYPITLLTKEMLHSDRYLDGEPLSTEDEKEVMEKLLPYHPDSEEKIGCGVDYIMVDRHPEFKLSRCLFVVRTDGSSIDFSYKECLRGYFRLKYPFCTRMDMDTILNTLCRFASDLIETKLNINFRQRSLPLDRGETEAFLVDPS